MEKVVSELWGKVLEEVKKEVNEAQFRAWFSPVKVRPASFGNDLFRLEVANRFIKSILHRNYRDIICRSLERHLGKTPEVEFVISGELLQLLRKKQDEEYSECESPPPASVTAASDGAEAGAWPLATVRTGYGPLAPYLFTRGALNSSYSFENFVVGSSNRLAAVSAQKIIETPGVAYNPLVLYGKHGLGKTHLLQAVSAEVLRRHPSFSTLFLPAETFTNEFMRAVASKSLDEFRAKVRSLDFLAVDDIQFFLGKKQTLQEFQYTLDAVVSAGRQVVLGVQGNPRDLDGMPAALSSRILGGLTIRLEAPDVELRCEIVRRKAQRWGAVLPQDVVTYIASHIDDNVREIEGAAAKVVAMAAADRTEVSMATARRALREYRALKEGPVSLEAIAKAVARRFEVSLKDLSGRSRLRSIAVPRQVAIYIAKQLTNYSLGEIGRYFGGRNHSTVLYAANRIAAELSENRELQRIIRSIRADLGR